MDELPDDRRDPRDDRDEGSRSTGWIIALVVLALLGALAVAYVVTNGFGANTPTPGQTTTVTSTQTRTQTPSKTSSSSSSSSSSSTTKTTPPTTTTTTGSAQSDAQLTRFVESYYRDVTKANKRDATFAQLTPKMQQSSGGRDGYEGFWSTIESVDVGKVDADSANDTATVELTFKPKDGDKSDETHTLTFVKDGDTWLIDSDKQQ